MKSSKHTLASNDYTWSGTEVNLKTLDFLLGWHFSFCRKSEHKESECGHLGMSSRQGHPQEKHSHINSATGTRHAFPWRILPASLPNCLIILSCQRDKKIHPYLKTHLLHKFSVIFGLEWAIYKNLWPHLILLLRTYQLLHFSTNCPECSQSEKITIKYLILFLSLRQLLTICLKKLEKWKF